jgi:hypothetical protein
MRGKRRPHQSGYFQKIRRHIQGVLFSVFTDKNAPNASDIDAKRFSVHGPG